MESSEQWKQPKYSRRDVIAWGAPGGILVLLFEKTMDHLDMRRKESQCQEVLSIMVDQLREHQRHHIEKRSVHEP